MPKLDRKVRNEADRLLQLAQVVSADRLRVLR